MTDTTFNHILDAAKHCFMQQGFRSTNMTLISEYSGYSRATVHKHLKNKDHAFKEVCYRFITEAKIETEKLLENETHDYWQTLEDVILIWLRPKLEVNAQAYILADLEYHLMHVAGDLIQSARQEFHEIIKKLVVAGHQSGQICLEKLNFSVDQFATVLMAGMEGLHNNPNEENPVQLCKHYLEVFKIATRNSK